MTKITNTSLNVNKIKKLTKYTFDTKHPNFLQCTIIRNEKVEWKGEFVLCNNRVQIHLFDCKNVTLTF